MHLFTLNVSIIHVFLNCHTTPCNAYALTQCMKYFSGSSIVYLSKCCSALTNSHVLPYIFGTNIRHYRNENSKSHIY